MRTYCAAVPVTIILSSMYVYFQSFKLRFNYAQSNKKTGSGEFMLLCGRKLWWLSV